MKDQGCKEGRKRSETTPWKYTAVLCETTCLYNHELSEVYSNRQTKNWAVTHLSFATIMDLELLPFHIDLETTQKLSYLSYEY